MNFKRNLKNVSFYICFGICLIIIGLLIYSSNKNIITKIIPSVSPKPQITQISLIIPTPIAIFAKVTKVIDGDTIEIEGGKRVRYIGMNTPEIENNECYASEASEVNRKLVLGKTVKLEKDVSETDKYGRLLRYIYLDNQMINDELVKFGSAKIETVPPDTKYKNEFLQSQTYAKENKLGLWGKCLR